MINDYLVQKMVNAYAAEKGMTIFITDDIMEPGFKFYNDKNKRQVFVNKFDFYQWTELPYHEFEKKLHKLILSQLDNDPSIECIEFEEIISNGR